MILKSIRYLKKMKITCLVVLVACAYAQASVSYDGIESSGPAQLNVPPIQVRAKTQGEEDAVADARLSSELAALSDGQRNFIEDRIKEALEGFRDVIINGNDDLPPLDPFVVDHIGPFQFTATGVRVSGNINNLHADGLRWYVVDEVNFNALRLTFGIHLTLPWLRVNGGYDAHARILLLNHEAGGNFRVFVNRLEVGVNLRVGTNLLAGHLTLRELDIKIDIHDTLIQMDGMFGSSTLNNLISGLVQSITQDVIQSEMQNVSEMLSEQLFDGINEFLKDYTLADILG